LWIVLQTVFYPLQKPRDVWRESIGGFPLVTFKVMFRFPNILSSTWTDSQPWLHGHGAGKGMVPSVCGLHTAPSPRSLGYPAYQCCLSSRMHRWKFTLPSKVGTYPQQRNCGGKGKKFKRGGERGHVSVDRSVFRVVCSVVGTPVRDPFLPRAPALLTVFELFHLFDLVFLGDLTIRASPVLRLLFTKLNDLRA